MCIHMTEKQHRCRITRTVCGLQQNAPPYTRGVAGLRGVACGQARRVAHGARRDGAELDGVPGVVQRQQRRQQVVEALRHLARRQALRAAMCKGANHQVRFVKLTS